MCPFTLVGDGVKVAVRVSPKASRDKIDGVVDTADGGRALKVAVTAPPEDGKANDAVLRLLAKAWKIPKSAMEVSVGAASRSKTVMIGAARPQDLFEFLKDWLARL